MPSRAPDRTNKSFSIAIVASVLLAFLITAALMGGVILWSVSEIDENGVNRQTRRVSHMLDNQHDVLVHEQASVSVWTGTLMAALQRNLPWLDKNVGQWQHDFFGHDASLIFDANNELFYASIEGKQQDTQAAAHWMSALRPMLETLRGSLAHAQAGDTPHISDFILLDGLPALVAFSPVVANTPVADEDTAHAPILVSVVRLNAGFAARLVDDYLIESGRFTITRSDGGEVAYPLTNRDGRLIAFYEWQPYSPGAQLLERAGPAMILAICLLGAIVCGLLFISWRASRALEGKRRDAERLALQDPLTGLPNRLQFDAKLRAMLHPERRQSVALLTLDLDRFKQINDTFGHQAGDVLIQDVAKRLQPLLQPDEVLARLGGDEFAIIVHRGRIEIGALTRQIIAAVSEPFQLVSSDAYVGVSIGVAIALSEDNDRNDLVRRADIALYEAKSAGRNRAVFYRPEMGDRLRQTHHLEADLREALLYGGQLWVAYQPLHGREPGEVIGAEALLRWTHPTQGPIAPSRFIAVAEGSGLIEPLGEFILEEVCRMAAGWPGFIFAVNVSPAQLRNPGFAQSVAERLSRHGLPGNRLEFELTESILIEDESVVTANLVELRHMGVRIALDDFGTGYSSLNYLKRYPVDRIKIDRAFVSQVSSNPASSAIVQAMITLSHALGIEVTAEGVETGDQHARLLAMGCNTFQGYLFAIPMNSDELHAALSAVQHRRADNKIVAA